MKTSLISAVATATVALSALASNSAMAQSAPSPAPTKVYDASSVLIGLNGVTVDSRKFDVRFVGGQTCAATFSGCNSNSDFTFDWEVFESASGALLAALKFTDFNEPTAARFNILTPGGIANSGTVGLSYAQFSATGPNSSFTEYKAASFVPSNDFGSVGKYAVWTASVAAVPEPGTYALMFVGLGAVGFIARRRTSQQAA